MSADSWTKISLPALASMGAALWGASPGLHAQVLPPPAPSPTPAQAELFIRDFQFEGATAFSEAELDRVTAPFVNRTVTAEELEEARRAVTLHYISHGYVNSGAVLPDQDPSGGVVKLRIVEGVLTGIEVRENRWLRDSYFDRRLSRWSRPPLNLNELTEGLQLLRQNENLERVNAELVPGTTPGESKLDLRVEDRHPFRLALEIDNHRPPSVGAEQVVVKAADLNVTGHGDALELTYGLANSGAGGDRWGFSGADDFGGQYTVPVGTRDTALMVHGSRLSTSIIEEPFARLDIDSETLRYGAAVRQPLYQTANQTFALAAGLERRQNESRLLGEPFDFAGSGSVGGETEVSVLGFSQEWVDRGANHVLALRSTFNFGLDAFAVTDSGVGGDPDAEFFSWLGQGQYVQRLFNTQNRAIVRLSGQWTGERLLALQQMSVGGAETVRGYRENQLVRDRAVVASLEFRIPLLFNKAGAGIVELAPFADFGGGWNVDQDREPETIGSVGIGLAVNPSKHFDAQLYWGYPLRDLHAPDEKNAQDLGLHFRIRIAAF